MRNFLIGAAFVTLIVVVMVVVGKRQWRRKEDALLARRANPTKQEFRTLIADDADPDVTDWLWDELQVYFQPRLTPHPDDDLVSDLPINSDEPNDWLSGFCQANKLRINDIQSWDETLPITVRNFATWLSNERRRLKSE